ncbi:unnamed protein product [Caenorhabditis angaria]|uniref:ABC transporter domain-containing protein n=1 Tax=Caenorhabditis angaria TaxID=860376 RepID=A0A9P1IZK0_9PELO|nr:unnamed protein product [Caenorhabditis angaria]
MQQFLLLFRKNILIWKRNKSWTIFEIIIPCILMMIYWGIFMGEPSRERYWNDYYSNSQTSYEFQVRGNIQDIQFQDRCKMDVKFAYSSAVECENETKKIMNIFVENFKNSNVNFNLLHLNSEDEIEKNVQTIYSYGSCSFNYATIGVYFDEINFDEQILKYRIIYKSYNQKWLLKKQTISLFAWQEKERTKYEEMGFLSFQHAIESTFINIIKNTNISSQFPINFQAFPEIEIFRSKNTKHLMFIPFVLAVIIFTNVVHITREVSAENEHLKGYLMTLGLSNFNFYMTHILSGILKSVFLYLITTLPFFVNGYISINNFFALSNVIFLYCISAITFGAFIASFFSTSDSAVKASITIWAILFGLFALFKPENHQEIFDCYIYALNPTGAFALSLDILTELIVDRKNLTFFNIFSESSSRFTLGNAISMLVFDIILMFGISLLADDYRRSNDDSFKEYFKSIFAKYRSEGVKSVRMTELQASEVLLEESNEYRNNDIENGIFVNNLVKIWGTTGEKAINGLSFEAKKGEVTILFGRNADGKSTTFHCISGMIPPTEGKIMISGRESNTNIGLCPQYNPIFDQLTVEEHLWFINGLKGNKDDCKFQAEMRRLLENVNLIDKKHKFSSNLSGGMKRKLCVCMALIGSSEVVLLDEPTAGLDPGARKDVQDLLETEKQNRTILLTTHYMDEAERLGDWILIMARGKLVISGSPKFLKKKYGIGYLLTVVLDDAINNNRDAICAVLKELCQFYTPEAQIGNTHGKQIEIILPEKCKSSFPILFRALEAIQRKEFTSEIFFILPNQLKDQLSILQITDYGLSLNKLEQVILTISEKLGTDATDGILNQNHEVKIHEKLESNIIEKSYNLQEFSPAAVVWKNNKNSMSEHLSNINKIVDKFSGFHNNYYDKSETLKNITVKFIGKIPHLLFGFTENTTLFNYRNQHTLWGGFDNQKIPTIECQINMHLGENPRHYGVRDVSENVLTGFFIVIFSLVTSSFVLFLVEEKVSKFAHQQLLTGISPITMYGAAIIFDFLVFSAICSIFLIFFYFFDYHMNYQLATIIQLWFLYFTSNVPFIYIISQYFKSPSKARIFIVIWQIFVSGSLVFFRVLALKSFGYPGYSVYIRPLFLSVQFIISVLFPVFSFGNAMIVGPMTQTRDPQFNDLWMFIDAMLLSSVLSSIAFLFLQLKSVQKYLSNNYSSWKYGQESRKYGQSSDFELSDAVVQERQKAVNANSSYSLVARNLTKKFGDFTALDNLSLAVSPNECFGLLGVNGCGKTTTFDILTGYSFATSGKAKIGGKNVTERIGIGYCPQFDSVLLDLTGREILEILAQMHGFINYHQKADIILESIGMQKQSNKLIRYYSGGQKRKISIGIALLSPTNSMIILDEPTAGIDPKARREIWELLIWSRQNRPNSALMLTSHSMDECEALCSRIAVLNHGKLIAIGSSQELKTLYGKSYTMTLSLNDSQNRENIVNLVNDQIPDAIFQTPETNKTLDLVWRIPKNPEDKWSNKFEMVQNLAKQLQVNDYVLSQSSL